MNESINKKLTLEYLLYTFLIMVFCWGSCIISGIAGLTMNKQRWLYAPYLLGGWSPTIGSYIALKRNRMVTGFKDWLKHVFDVKQSMASYLITIFLATVVSFLPLMLISGFEQTAPVYMLVVMVPAMLFCGGLEEAGWRYILLPELEKKYRFLPAAVITAAIWWLWHLPLFFIPATSQYGQSFLGFGIGVLGMSFGLAAVRKNTGSVWLCVLMHSIQNALRGVFSIHDGYIGSIVTTAITIAFSIAWVKIHEMNRSKQTG